MALYGNSLVVPYDAWDTDTNAPAAGDAANHTIRLVRDGVAVAATNTPSDVEDGVCAIALTAAEMRCGSCKVKGTSTTANVIILPLTILTERGPSANTVTVTVSDGATVFPNVLASVSNQAETSPAWQERTDENGHAVFYLPTGDWRALVGADGLQGGGAQNFTVAGATPVAITVTAVTLPAPVSADNYLLWDNETKLDDGDASFGTAMTVKVVAVSVAAQTDATANAQRSIMGIPHPTVNGQWSFEIAKALAGSRITLEKTWTDAASIGQTERWEATILASAANGSDQIAWADLSPRKLA